MDIRDYILLNTTGNLYWKDIHGRYLGCNLEFARVAGVGMPENIVGKTDWDLLIDSLGEEGVRKIEAVDKDVIENDTPSLTEETGIDHAGNKATYLTKKMPLKDEAGKTIGLMGTSIDITEQKKIEQVEKQLHGMTIVAAAIAHELRSPLLTLKSAAQGIDQVMPRLIEAYHAAQSNNLAIPDISIFELDLLKKTTATLERKVDQANLFIDMLLANIHNPNNAIKDMGICSARTCINKALSQYIFPFGKKPEILWDDQTDFEFRGNETMVIHVFLNLLKNAAYFIQKAQKGHITIWIENTPNLNVVHFKDTAFGIKKENIDRIFDPFFTSDTNKGTGIGLAFCKMIMELLQGQITCKSSFGEYTEFELFFPKTH